MGGHAFSKGGVAIDMLAMNSITLETKKEGTRTRAVKPSEHAIVVIANSTQRADNLEAAVGPWLAQFFRRKATEK